MTAHLPGYRPDERMRWGLWDATIAILVFMGLVLAGALLVALTPLGDLADQAPEAADLVAAVVAYGALVALVVRASRRKGLGSLSRDFGLRLRLVDLGLGLALGVAVKIASVLLTAVVIAGSGHAPATGNLVVSDDTLWVVLNAVLIAVIVAPIAEELLFRGLVLRAVYNTVARWRGHPQPPDLVTQARASALAILVSAAAFTLLHLYQSSDPVLLTILGLSTMVLGLVNGYVTLRTGRMGAAIVAHVVFNGSGVLFALLARAVG